MTKSGVLNIGRCRPNSAKRPHSINSRPQGLGRSCYETESSAMPQGIASGSWQPTELSAKCQQTGTRAWRTPTPTLTPRDFDPGGFLFFHPRKVVEIYVATADDQSDPLFPDVDSTLQ